MDDIYNYGRILERTLNRVKNSKIGDIIKLVQEIESRDYSDWTKRDYKIVIKRLFKWLKKSNEYP